MICQRCGLEGAIDIDTGSRCHAESSECIALLRADRERLTNGVAALISSIYRNAPPALAVAILVDSKTTLEGE